MANLQTNLDYIACKDESTPGTAEALADANFDIRAHDIQISLNYAVDDDNSKHATGDHTEAESVPGAQSATLTFWTYLAWGGAVDTAPNQAKLWKACGAVETAYGVTGIEWNPESANDNNTMTFFLYRKERGGTPAALTFKMAGAVGNCKIGADGIGASHKCMYEFQGKLTEIEDTANGALLSLTSPDTTVSEKLIGCPFTVGGTTLSISSFELDFGNEIQGQTNQNDASNTGYDYFAITARRPRFSCNPYQQLAANFDVHNIFTNSTVGALSLATADSTPHFTISAPRAQMLPPGVSDREGSGAWELNYKLLRNTAGADDTDKERAWTLLQGATS